MKKLTSQFDIKHTAARDVLNILFIYDLCFTKKHEV